MQKKILILLECSFLILLSALIFSCNITNKAERIDAYLDYCYENGLLNGAVLVAEHGDTIYSNTFGYLNLETEEPLKENSPFYLASVSKQFTTMAIMMLKEQGKLSYEDKLSDYFPEFPAYAEQVTLRHMMTHTSGIPDHFALGAYKPDLTNRDVLNLLVQQDTLDFMPGEKYSYSNGAYVLLSMIVAKVAGKPFNVFLRDHIFNPLKMNYSLVYDESKQKIPFRAIGFNMFGEKDDYNILTTGSGGIFSTTQDLFKWDQALYTDKLVTSETLEEAFTPFKLNNDSISYYGFGWRIIKNGSGKAVVHSGGLAGYRTFIGRYLDKKNTIIILTNKGNAIRVGDISEAILNILNNQQYQLPKIPIAIKMYQIIQKQKINEAIIEYRNLKQSQNDSYDFSESQLNSLGYYLLGKKRIGEAIEVFKLNVNEYPDAYNTYDSLGEAYLLNGDMNLAVKNYEKSLELNPDNRNAVKMLSRIRAEQ